MADALGIQVRNRNFEDVLIFADVPGGRRRIGVVSGRSERAFRMDWPRENRIEFLLRLGNGFSCTSRTYYAAPGRVITLIVESEFRQSPACMEA